MNAPLLTLLTAAIAALLGLGGIGAAWRQQARPIVWCAAAVAGVAAGLALLDLLLGEPAAAITLPVGLPGATFRLVLDPLAAFFAAVLFCSGAAMLAFHAATEQSPRASAVPVCLAFLGLAVLGADGLPRATGIAVAGAAIWAAGPADRGAALQLGVALLAAAAVAAAPPQAGLWAALIGPGALAGLVPLHGWLQHAHRASTRAAALLSGAAVPTALYLMLRLLFSSAAVPPGWWGLPLLLLGAAGAIAGGLDAILSPELDTAVAAGTVRQTGLAAIGLGLALSARAADLPAVANMALAAVLLLAILQAVGGTLLALIDGAVHAGAGTRRLDRLGGLVHRMPVTTACLFAGLVGLTALPPGAGFAALWLLFHAVLGQPHAAALPAQLLLCALVAVLGLSAALGTAGMLRVVGMACLGRPRTPRAAVAEEPPRPARRVLLALATVALLWGVFVGPLLILLADSPIRSLTGAGLGPLASWRGLAPGSEFPGYDVLPLACLLLMAAGAVFWLRRLLRVQPGSASGPAWDEGFAAPPAWLPFGDPATQTGGTGFAPAFITPTEALLSPDPGAAGRSARASTAWLCTARASIAWFSLARVPNAWASSTRISAFAGGEPLRRIPPSAGNAPAVVLILLAALLVLCAWVGVA